MTRTARWTIALALLLTVAALAGCVGSATSAGDAGPTDAVDGASDADDEAENAGEGSGDADAETEDEADDEGGGSEANAGAGDETTPSAVPSSLTFRGCDIQVGVFEIPAPLVADHVPPGFAATSVLQPAGPTASFVVDAHGCANATSDALDAPVEDVGWVSYLLAVDPPDAYEAEDVDFYFLPLTSVTGSSEVADVYEAWSFAFEEGTVDLTSTGTPAARTGQLEVESNNVSSTLHTAVSPDPAGEDPSHKGRWFEVSDGEVTSIVEPNVTASSRFLGGAERVLEPGSSDPGGVPLWAAENAKTMGPGQHFTAERIDFQPLDSAEVAGS